MKNIDENNKQNFSRDKVTKTKPGIKILLGAHDWVLWRHDEQEVCQYFLLVAITCKCKFFEHMNDMSKESGPSGILHDGLWNPAYSRYRLLQYGFWESVVECKFCIATCQKEKQLCQIKATHRWVSGLIDCSNQKQSVKSVWMQKRKGHTYKTIPSYCNLAYICTKIKMPYNFSLVFLKLFIVVIHGNDVKVKHLYTSATKIR